MLPETIALIYVILSTGSNTPIPETLIGTLARQAQAIAERASKKPVRIVSPNGGRIMDNDPSDVLVFDFVGCGLLLDDMIVGAWLGFSVR